MTQFYSRHETEFNGDRIFSVPFSYLNENDISVLINGEVTTGWEWLNATQIMVNADLKYKDKVEVRRNTPIDEKIVDYKNTSMVLNDENLNKSQNQILNAVQEIYDNNIQFKIDTNNTIDKNKENIDEQILNLKQDINTQIDDFDKEQNEKFETFKTEINDNVEAFKNDINTNIEEVLEASEKVNQLEESVATAANASKVATEQATIATNQATIATNKANEAINTVANTLNKTQITNCLLEVPQNIKLELNNGVLTLKKGSKVIVPNGFESNGTTPKFEYRKISADITRTGGTANKKVFVMLNSGLNIIMRLVETSSSGITETTDINNGTWYDTANNVVKAYYGASPISSGCTLPLAIASCDSSGAITSIDQVFNGFGYIGSTVWVDKGVKGLIPNDKNGDGTYKSIEYTTSKLSIVTGAYSGTYLLRPDGSFGIAYFKNYAEQPTKPSFVNGDWFDTNENVMYHIENGNTRKQEAMAIFKVIAETDGGRVVSLNPKQPFRAVDYNDAILKSQLEECQVVVETYQSGTSWYDVYSNGKIRQGVALTANGTVTFLKPFSNTDYSVVSSGCIRYSSKTATAIAISDINVGNSDKPFPCYLVFEGK